MNPYYSNWSYGYTLGASTEQSRGAYTVQKPPYSQGGGSAYPPASSGPTPGYSGASSGAGYPAPPKSAGSGAGYSQPAGPSGASGYSAGAGYSASSGSGYLGGSSGSGYGAAKSGSWYGGANSGPGYSGAGYSGANSWSQVKGSQGSAPLPKAQLFVTASGKSATSNDRPSIGPNQPIKSSVTPTLDQASVALTKLHDLAMQNKLVERYDTVEEKAIETAEGTSTEFKVNLFLGTETYQGTGSTLKQAKQVAAVQALRVTKYQTANERRFSMAKTGRRIGVTATSELHELSTKKGVRLDFKFLEPFNFEFKHAMRMWDKKEMLGNYRVQLNVAGYEFYGQAELPQQAKHSAATQAIPIVRNLPDPSGSAAVVHPPLPKTKHPSQSVKAEADSSNKDTKAPKPFHTDKNINMALNEIAMLNNCVPEWTLIGESGPPHQKQFSWQLRLGEFSTMGVGPNKKLARTTAAEQMMATLPEEWKQSCANKKSQRRGPPPAAKKRAADAAVAKGGEGTPAKKKAEDDGKIVITADNPISCLFEYTKKVKIPDPEFECVQENLLETWQRASQTFKKVEYTIELRVDGKTYLATHHTKKAAKQACAVEAWNSIRATLL